MAEKKRNPFVWIVMILLFIGLLGFGTGNLGGNVRSLGTIGDKDLSIASYQGALNNQIRAVEAQTGQRLTLQQARQSGLTDVALQQVVLARTLDHEADSLGISVGDARVREEVLRIPAFRNLQGEFDREAYALSLRRQGQSEGEFETRLREEIARTILQGAVVGGIPAPQAFTDAVVGFEAETRDITYALLTRDDLAEPLPGPTPADLQAYYTENPAPFTAPEAREISFAWIIPDMILSDVDVPEDSLRAIYDARIDEFVVPERRLVERLVFADAAAADSAAAQLEVGGTTFDALVADRGLSLSDIDLGDVLPSDLGPAADAVFAASAGDVVGPFETSLGPALFRMNAVLSAENTTFEEAMPALRSEQAFDQATRRIAAQAEQINDLLAGGATVEDLAERTDMQLGRLTLTPDTTDGPAAYDSFREAAATATEGAFPELMETADGGLFVLRLDGITPPTLRPFDDVADDVAAAWTADTAQGRLIAQAEETAQQISPLTTFETLGLTPIEADNLTRTTFLEGTPPGFVSDVVYRMDQSQVQVVPNGTDGAVIVRLDRIAAPDPADDRTAAMTDSVGQLAAQGIAQDIFDAFATAVQGRTDVNINPAVLDAVLAQY